MKLKIACSLVVMLYLCYATHRLFWWLLKFFTWLKLSHTTSSVSSFFSQLQKSIFKIRFFHQPLTLKIADLANITLSGFSFVKHLNFPQVHINIKYVCCVHCTNISEHIIEKHIVPLAGWLILFLCFGLCNFNKKILFFVFFKAIENFSRYCIVF